MKKSYSYSKIPSSVYRLQIHENFPLKKAIKLLPYLHALGVDGVYCSPLMEAAGSSGYDIINPHRLDPKIGTPEEYQEFCELLAEYKMAQVLDVVPNHMGIKHNPWWQEVLEYGQASPFAEFFDIDWNPTTRDLRGKILLPILGTSYGKSLEEQKISLVYEEGGFWIRYADYRLPVALATYSFILENPLPDFDPQTDESTLAWEGALAVARELKRLELEESDQLAKKREQKALLQLQSQELYVHSRIERLITLFNGSLGVTQSFDLLHELLERQFYRLAHWLVGGQEINYRRFFNINELVAIHMEKERVFQEYHSWLFDLLDTGKIQGLRIDHPDGLYDPTAYFARIQSHHPAFVIAEKITDFREPLPTTWEIDGTVGYDFLNVLNGVFIDKNHERMFNRTYEKFIGKTYVFEDLLYERKKRFLRLFMGSEMGMLGRCIDRLSSKNRHYRDFTRNELTEALKEIIACFPVYRTYIRPHEEISKRDRGYISQAIEIAKRKTPEIDTDLYDYLKNLLLLQSIHLENEQEEAFDFLLRFQQYTAPVMAKGLEDSCYYIYNRLISLNEVGSNLRHFGFSKAEFHQCNRDKLEQWSLGLLATSTHDSKYSGDVRMRLSVLSEMPSRWHALVNTWRASNARYKRKGFPDSNTEYYLYQMLIGVWPSRSDPAPDLLERLWSCLLKVIREADVHTCWRFPNPEYEESVRAFFMAILQPDTEFFPSFLSFADEIARFGQLNSLAGCVMKMGSCGIVDIYQGNETWNYALVDPDNRRPVDYTAREEALKKLEQGFSVDDSDLKLFVTHRALQFRRAHKELFLRGDYIPLTIQGEKRENAIAWLRRDDKKVAIIAAGRFFTKLGEPARWDETYIVLPSKVDSYLFTDIFTRKKHSIRKVKNRSLLPLSEIFSSLPCAILTNSEEMWT